MLTSLPEAPEEPAVPSTPRVASLELADVGSTLASCDARGFVTGCSPSAHALLARIGVDVDALPAALPPLLWQLVTAQNVGDAVQWRPSRDEELLLGCTRYRLGADRWLLIMSEISHKQSVLAQRLHQQRLEAIGRLVATTAHDLRSPLAAIVFNSDVLEARHDELSAERVREAASDIKDAASRMRATIDCLLDYVKLGPPQPAEISVREILTRAHSLLRPHLRAGAHRVVDELSATADRALCNPITLEQIFVNLVLNSIEAAAGAATVRVSSTRVGATLRIVIDDDGPGIPEAHRLQVFDPFFTTKRDGTGIGLSSAREAVRAAGGDLQLVRWRNGAAFAILLPASPAMIGDEA